MWCPYHLPLQQCIGVVASHIGRAQPPTNPQTGVYFTQPPRRNPAARVLVPGSGMTKPSKRTFLKRPHTSLSTVRPPGGVHRHTTTPRQRGGRHATGPVSAHRRDGIFRAPIYERDWRPSCIVRRSSSSSSEVSGARTAIRVTTAVSSLLKLRLLVGELLANSEGHYSTPAKSPNCTPFPKFGWRSGPRRIWRLATPVLR